MSDNKWIRPDTVPFPSVWHTFQAKDCASDHLVNYRVQDLPEDRYEDAVEHMVKYFLEYEPLCIKQDTINCPESVVESRNFWRKLVQAKMTLACFKDGSEELIGVNILAIMGRNDKTIEMGAADRWRKVLEAVIYVGSAVDIHEKYNVDYYMSAFGLTIQPKYTGRGIAQHMLAARVTLGRAVGVPLTSTVFTNIASQIPATRAGFEVDYECTADEFVTNGMDFAGLKPIKLMTLKFD